MFLEKKTINEHFLNKKPPLVEDALKQIKQIKDDLYRDSW